MLELSEIKWNVTWYQAMDYAKELGNKWVLPEDWQLKLMQKAKQLGHSDFQDMRGCFWSSSTDVSYSSSAWYVSFNYGYVGYDYKANSNYARCVRGSFVELLQWVEERNKQ
jgi:hypothetical protein